MDQAPVLIVTSKLTRLDTLSCATMGPLTIHEQEERSLLLELRKEVDGLEELGKKLRIEGVKESIDKVSRFLILS